MNISSVGTPVGTLHGYSRSGDATCLWINDMSVVFDMGACPVDCVTNDRVFITHGHADHVTAVAKHAQLRQLRGIGRDATYFVPDWLVDDVKSLVETSHSMEGSKASDRVFVSCPERGVVTNAGRTVIEHFPVRHSIRSMGYTICETRNKLKLEYHGLDGREVRKLRESGVDVHDVQRVPLVTFLGDHTVEPLTLPEIWDVKVLIVECTYLKPEDLSRAEANRHTHLDQLMPLLREHAHATECVVLKHFSLRYKDDEVRSLVATALSGLPDLVRKVRVIV